MNKKAIILLSGGLDSATCLAIAKDEGYECHALSFDYGQRHHSELNAAIRVVKFLNAASHRIVKLDLAAWHGSSLTDDTLAVPDYGHGDAIPNTYVPARNTLFLSYALGVAEILDATDIFFGANIVDYSNYPDCRPEFLKAFEQVANLGTKKGVEGAHFQIHTPLLYDSKSDIIKKGAALHLDYSLTISCYQPNHEGQACGRCDSCTYRKEGFKQAGIDDPTSYR